MPKKDKNWVIIDTETTGIIDPIYILEVYAQKMEGLTPKGDPLHLYINHNIPIPAEATAIHGYTESFISKVGIDPHQAHKAIEEYCGSDPISSHNLGYDWCRCLIPERKRLNRGPKLLKGFCTLQLFRRTLETNTDYKLTTLKERYNITHPENCPSHSAKGDVLTVLEILRKEVSPVLVKNNITTVGDIKKLSTLTPISLCREKLGIKGPYKINEEDLNKPVEQVILETLAETLDLTDIEDSKILELDKWLSIKNKINPKLSKEVEKIVSRGIIAPDQRIEILEMIQPVLPLTEPASKKQKNYLKRLGARYNEGITKAEASEMIDEFKKKARNQRIEKSHSVASII